MTKDQRAVVVAYGAALLVALGTGLAIDAEHPLAVVLAADLAATLAIFCFSLAFDNSSFYDAYWSVAPPVIAVYFAFGPEAAAANAARQALVLALVAAWGARLTWNWARGWTGLAHEDWRYVEQRARTGRLYWLVSLVGLHLMPTLVVFLGCLALRPALTSGAPLGLLDALAALATAGAIGIEARADAELHRFRTTPREPAAILASGLWSRSRHPNYFGEMGFWWGLWLFALAADPGAWWTVVGALAVTALFLGVSLPLMERRMLERRPHYAELQKQIPLVVPRLRV
jgi:steroid 5-alpha reductase family enzyme